MNLISCISYVSLTILYTHLSQTAFILKPPPPLHHLNHRGLVIIFITMIKESFHSTWSPSHSLITTTTV